MTTQRRGPYAKTAQVKQRIVDAALTVFAEAGYRATTMKEIAARAEISQRGLVHHFPTKEDLLLEVLSRYEDESAVLMAEDHGHQQIDGLLAVARHNLEHSALLELQNLLSAEGTTPDHPAHERFAQRYDDLRWVLTDAFAAIADRGGARAGLSPDELASMYVALLDGLQLQWLYNREAVDVERSLRTFLDLVCREDGFGRTDEADSDAVRATTN